MICSHIKKSGEQAIPRWPVPPSGTHVFLIFHFASLSTYLALSQLQASWPLMTTSRGIPRKEFFKNSESWAVRIGKATAAIALSSCTYAEGGLSSASTLCWGQVSLMALG